MLYFDRQVLTLKLDNLFLYIFCFPCFINTIKADLKSFKNIFIQLKDIIVLYFQYTLNLKPSQPILPQRVMGHNVI